MRIAGTGDTARSLINVGARLGIACGLCKHRVLADLSKLPDQERDVWTYKFKCRNCGETHTVFKYVLIGEQDVKYFEAGEHPKGHQHGSTL